MKPDLSLFMRFAALAFAILAITLGGIQLLQRPAPAVVQPPSAPVQAADRLRAELARCQTLGEAGAGDIACLAAWTESRRRFLGQSADVRSR